MHSMRAFNYNPAFLSHEERIRSFSTRLVDLELIVEVIAENTDQSNQHVLVVGSAGMGKTTLVLRVVTEILRREELSNLWHPIVFAEESYNVSSPGEFWLEALFHLSRGQKEERWGKTHEELCRETNEVHLRERAIGQLKDFAMERGKRLLLVVENFHMLLGRQISDDDAWKLRHTFMNERYFMILGSAPHLFEQILNPGKAMFQLFKIHELGSLDAKECRALRASVSGEYLKGSRIRPIQILTGGNPRSVTLISHSAGNSQSRELMNDLIHLVDDRTAYFKRVLDSLPPLERKVLFALADLWKPSTSREIANASRIDVNKTSACLKRLCNKGIVKIVAQKGRKKWHRVADRMLNFYHLLRRHGGRSERVRALVRFMTVFYDCDESRIPTQTSESLHNSLRRWMPGKARDVEGTVVGPCERPRSVSSQKIIVGSWAENVSRVVKKLKNQVKTGAALSNLIGFFVKGAAMGHADQALDILEENSDVLELTPVAVGIRLFLGEEVLEAHEIMETGRDVALRIKEKMDSLQTS